MADRSWLSDIDRLSEAINNLQKSLECTICLELMTEPTKTRCGHSFCKVCIGGVLRKKSASCPLCNKSLNRRNISKDDHLQTCIEKFNTLVTAIEMDSHIDILSHSKQPCDTKESCSYSDARQSNRDCNTEKPSKKERSIRQMNQSGNRQTDKPSTSRGTMIDCDNPRYDLNVSKKKSKTLSNLSRVRTCPGDENDNAIHTPNVKVCTWLHFPNKRSADDWITKDEIQPIEDKARPMNPISDDNGKSDEIDKVYRDRIDASRKPSQDRKRSTDCPEHIDEDCTLSQVNKGARQIGEVIEIDSAPSGLKYKASHTRIRTKENREKDTSLKSDFGETVNQSNSSSTTAYDQVPRIAASAPSSLSTMNTSAIAEQSTTNWSRVIQFGKEMKRARKRKVKKLDVSTEKNKNLPRIIEDIKLSSKSRYDSVRIAASYNESEKEANVSNRLEKSNSRKQDAIDKSLNLSEAKVKALSETNSQTELFDKNKSADSLKSSSTYSTMNTSYITLEEGRQIRIINLNNDQVSKIIGLEDATGDSRQSQNQHHEENVADYRRNSLLSLKRLTVLTPEKLNESIHKRDIIRDVSQTFAVKLGSSSCLPAEKRTNQGREPVVKFMQLGSLIRQRNVKYFLLGATKREQSMPAKARIIPICNMQQTASGFEVHVATSNPWNDSQSLSNITVMKNSFANNANLNQAVSRELPTVSSVCKASATSTSKRDIDSHLNQKKSSAIANQRSYKSIENVAEKDAASLHRTSRADRSAISRAYPGTSNSIKLLSPDKDSQLKFLEIDSPMNKHKELRRASSIKTAIKGNNFSEMESSRLTESTLGKAREPFIESSYKKRKRMRCANDRELFEDGSSDRNDDSSDLASDSSRSTIKLDTYNQLSKKAGSSRLDVNKKRRLSSPDDEDVEVIPSISKDQDASRRKSKIIMSSSDTESESATHVKLKRYRDDPCAQRNTSITNTATKKCPAKQDSDENLCIQNIIDKWSNEYDATRKKLTRESKNNQSSIKSMRNPPEENPASHQSSHSTNTPKMEKRKNKSSQKSSARESDIFETNSVFNSENLDYILQQPTLNADHTSKKIVDSNDDIINKVLQIDRSRNNSDACRPPDSAPRNEITSQKEKDNREYLLQDNFDEIIASVEQPQSEDFIPCTEQPNRNPNRPLAKQKTSNCLAITDESYAAMQETPILPASSANDMFEYHSPRNIRKPPTTNAISRNSDKENVVCSQKRHVGDQRDRKDETTNADAIDKDSRKKIVSKHNVSRKKEKCLEERNISIQSASRLHVSDGERATQRATAAGNESNSKDDTFEHDSLMNITQHQIQLQMFEEDLFGIAATRNQTKTTKTISQDSPSQKEQRTPRKRKQNIQNKDTEPEERFADEDDVVENTPEKKMKNSGNNVKTIEAKESTKIAFLSPISRTPERIPSTSGQCRIHPFPRSSASTPTNLLGMHPFSQSTPIIAQNSRTISRPDIFGGNKRTERIESGSILLAKQVDAKTLENVRRLPDKRNLCFVCSGLSTVQITTVKEFAAKYNANYMNQFDHDVTHIIMKTTGEQNAAKSTLKYLQGIAHRKWIVSYRWIEDCIRQQKLLDEVPYEATTQNDGGINGAGPRNSRLRDKDLFEGFTFLCVGPYDNVSLSQYQDLLLATGAVVVNSIEVLAKKEGIKGIVIQDNVHGDKIIEHWYRTTKAAPIVVDWIVECIGQYKLFKLAPYIVCLSPQDFCAIGYPRELVEEDEEYSDDE